MAPIELNDLDRGIWESEIEGFVPSRVFDAHTHVYRRDHCLSPETPDAPRSYDRHRLSDLAILREVDRQLLPGRETHYLAFGYPFERCDFDGSAKHTAATVASDPTSAGLMVVSPQMPPEWVRERLVSLGLVGMKPYRFYAANGDTVECRITDMLPEPLIEVADDLGLIVTLHLGKRNAIADADNVADVKRLAAAYPNVTWILAHCARSFAPWPIDATCDEIAGLPNVYMDTSAVCESDVFSIVLRRFDRARVLYGSDNIPAGIERGKYVAFGRAWAFVGERTENLDLSHCDPRPTFVCYESLRALRRAAEAAGLTREEVEGVFWGNAVKLLGRVRDAARR